MLTNFWEELTTNEIKKINRKTVLIFPFSSIEQHGPHLPLNTDKKILEGIKLAEMCIVSQVELKDISDKSIDAMSFEEEKIAVVISLASGEKCERCWTVLPEVDSNPHNLCERCDTVWQSFQ